MRQERFRCELCGYILVRVLPKFYGMRCSGDDHLKVQGGDYYESKYLPSTVCPLCKEECVREVC